MSLTARQGLLLASRVQPAVLFRAGIKTLFLGTTFAVEDLHRVDLVFVVPVLVRQDALAFAHVGQEAFAHLHQHLLLVLRVTVRSAG